MSTERWAVQDTEQAMTEDMPESGVVSMAGVMISAAIRWINDDGAHVIQSSEFDVTGVGYSWDEALHSFWTHASDLFEYIAELTDENQTSEHEQAVALLLGPRLVDALGAWSKLLEREIESRRANFLSALNLRRRHVIGKQTWRPDPQTRRTSGQLSRA